MNDKFDGACSNARNDVDKKRKKKETVNDFIPPMGGHVPGSKIRPKAENAPRLILT